MGVKSDKQISLDNSILLGYRLDFETAPVVRSQFEVAGLVNLIVWGREPAIQVFV
jgi:hypothetical protein